MDVLVMFNDFAGPVHPTCVVVRPCLERGTESRLPYLLLS